eukprot:scaffold52708_cov27-Phaeocystis_antarctica.AAC.1
MGSSLVPPSWCRTSSAGEDLLRPYSPWPYLPRPHLHGGAPPHPQAAARPSHPDPNPNPNQAGPLTLTPTLTLTRLTLSP